MPIIFKCKMCGGNLEITADMTVTTCPYCDLQQTLPKDTDETKANLFNRANHFRVGKEFDKAIGIYETILNEYADDAEAHWGTALCKYGIEYVTDPQTGKKVPTCHRLQYESILNSPDYQAAIENADVMAQQVYRDEAQAIDAIQKKILFISSREQPFDAFICYKEKDEQTGGRTKDSVRAQDLYAKMTAAGLRVFFARITLEDKLGMEYEPYIFAALNSAKAMIVVGSKPEHFNGVWVKNEWNRFLLIVKEKKDRVLIPAYFDMDPYDMPTEFAHLQAQDMNKIGFEQDLIRGIQKVVKPVAAAAVSAVNKDVTVDSLLERAYMFLKDGDFNKANEYFERVLDRNPKDHQAYWGQFLCELKCIDNADVTGLMTAQRVYEKIAAGRNALYFSESDFEKIKENKSFAKAIDFAPDSQKTVYMSAVDMLIGNIIETCYNPKYETESKLKAESEERARRQAEDDKIKRELLERKKQLELKNNGLRLKQQEAERTRIEQKRKRKKKNRRIRQVICIIFIIVLVLSLLYIMFKTDTCTQFLDSDGIEAFYIFIPYAVFSFILAIIVGIGLLGEEKNWLKNSSIFPCIANACITGAILYVLAVQIWMSSVSGRILLTWTAGLLGSAIGIAVALLPSALVALIFAGISKISSK